MSGVLLAGAKQLRAGVRVDLPQLLIAQRRTILTGAAPEFKHPCYKDLPKTTAPYPIVMGFPLAAMSQMMTLMSEGKYQPVTPPVCFIGDKRTQSWIGNIHDDHRHREWGQKLRVFPSAIQARLCKIRPGLLRDPQVLWGDMQDLYHYMLLEAQEAGFKIIEQSVSRMSAEGIVTTKQGDTFTPDNPLWFVYNFAQAHRTPTVAGLETSPHTEMYTKSIEEIRSLGNSGLSACTVGNGLSFVWWVHHLGQYFPNTLCLHTPGSRTPLPPSISQVDFTKASMADIHQATIRQVGTDLYEVQAPCSEENTILTVLVPNLLSTAGLEPCTYLTEDVPEHRKVDQPGLRVAPLFASSATVVWGSLPELSLRMQERGDEAPLIHHAYSVAMLDKLQLSLKETGVVLPDNYKTVLKSTLDAQPEHEIGGPEYLLQLHMSVFDQAIQKATDQPMAQTRENRKKYEAFLREKLALPKTATPKPKLNP